MQKKHAYVAGENAELTGQGDVLFNVSSYADYGKLSGQNLEQLQVGSRVEVDNNKIILLILFYGNQQSLANQVGHHLGGREDLVGILNVLP